MTEENKMIYNLGFALIEIRMVQKYFTRYLKNHLVWVN